jgi:virulence-associated protein VapD
MFAISFDLHYWETQQNHPSGLRQAYKDIENTMGRYGFRRIQQSVYATDDTSLVSLNEAMAALKALPWFPSSVKDIRAFRVENWSDFTPVMKGSNR